MTRSDHPTGTDRLAEVVNQLALDDDAIVVNVQGDEPLIPASAIELVAALLVGKPDAAIATLCHPIHDAADAINPNVVKCVIDEAGLALYFSRAPIPYARDAWTQGVAIQSVDLLRLLTHALERRSFTGCGQVLDASTLEADHILRLRAIRPGNRLPNTHLVQSRGQTLQRIQVFENGSVLTPCHIRGDKDTEMANSRIEEVNNALTARNERLCGRPHRRHPA